MGVASMLSRSLIARRSWRQVRHNFLRIVPALFFFLSTYVRPLGLFVHVRNILLYILYHILYWCKDQYLFHDAEFARTTTLPLRLPKENYFWKSSPPSPLYPWPENTIIHSPQVATIRRYIFGTCTSRNQRFWGSSVDILWGGGCFSYKCTRMSGRGSGFLFFLFLNTMININVIVLFFISYFDIWNHYTEDIIEWQ